MPKVTLPLVRIKGRVTLLDETSTVSVTRRRELKVAVGKEMHETPNHQFIMSRRVRSPNHVVTEERHGTFSVGVKSFQDWSTRARST